MDHIITGLEVAFRSQIISSSTYQKELRAFIPSMKDSDTESNDAQADLKKQQTQELEQTKALAKIKPASSNGNGHAGPNSAGRVANAVPLDTAPPPASG
jgi:hypothetical protein